MKRLVVVLAACAAPDASPPAAPIPKPPPPPPLPYVAPPDAPEVWLRGTTHVHAKPSGDSTEPIHDVIHWYERHGYDFIVLTDHNRVTEVDGNTTGNVAVHAQAKGLMVLAGTELTFNPDGCLPHGDASGRCRIHVNALGVTARPPAKIDWANRKTHERVDMYQAAYVEAHNLGARLIQINHPNYYWGMTPEVLTTIGGGAQLLEIANVQFEKWNHGDKDHLSVEAQWDLALGKGVKLWGVATDDAHDYPADPHELSLLHFMHGHGKYPAGGGWVMVKARRDPQAILDALAQGHFYATTGVTLARAEVEAGELVVEVAPDGSHHYTIEFIVDGKAEATTTGLVAKHPVPQTGYVRAVVTRDDGKRAWVQPATR